MADIKNLPHNLDAEKAVLGSMIIDKVCASDGLGLLVSDDFYESKHKDVFNAIYNLMIIQHPVDIQTLTDELIRNKTIDNVGGAEYLQELTDTVISISNFDYYLNIVRNHSILRSLLLKMDSTIRKYNSEKIDDISQFVAGVQDEITRIAEKRRIAAFIDNEQLIDRVKNDIDTHSSSTRNNEVTGIDTGYYRLNKATNGFQKGDMIVIAARPSVGKTALAMNILYNASVKSKVPVAFFSLEMSSVQVGKRLVASVSNVPLDKINTGFISNRDKIALENAYQTIQSTEMFIDDTSNEFLLNIIAKARKLKNQKPDLGLIVIDYLGLISTPSKKNEPRHEQVRIISAQLKQLARELNIPVVVLCQLNRKAEEREGIPMLSDLKESGAIEQDADIVILMYRKDYQQEAKNAAKKAKDLKSNEQKDAKEILEQKHIESTQGKDVSLVNINIAKNRNGKTDLFRLFFFKNVGRFDNPTEEFERLASTYEE